jgi:hypothetical protein
MNEVIHRMSDEIENEIKSLIFTKSTRLTILLDKYPLSNMETFFQDFTVEQLDKIYRYGCISKMLVWCSKGYAMNVIQPIIFELTQLPQHIIIRELTSNCWPKGGYNNYWQNNNTQPSKEEYIRSICDFCNNVLNYSKNNQVSDKTAALFLCEDLNKPHNENFIYFCEKLVHDVIVGSLIIRNSHPFSW